MFQGRDNAPVWDMSGHFNLGELAAQLGKHPEIAANNIFLFGVMLILVGLNFKISAFPFQIRAPDVFLL